MVTVIVNGDTWKVPDLMVPEFEARLSQARELDDYVTLAEWIEFNGEFLEAPAE